MNEYQIEELQLKHAANLEVLAERAANKRTSVFKESARRAVEQATCDMDADEIRELLTAALAYIRPLK
jgi:hypothetical protein